MSSESSRTKLTVSPLKSFVQTVFIPVCVFVISLGSFSEAFLLMGDFKNLLVSSFSNDFEYETLSDINVGNTDAYLDGLIGAPTATKKINESVRADYYINKKYVLTCYMSNDRLEAYTVVASIEGFSPLLPWSSGQELGAASIGELIAEPKAFSFDHANTNSFYIQSSVNELKGLFLNSYLGAVTYGSGSVDQQALDDLYRAEVYGAEDESLAKAAIFRESVLPNFFGQGELDIETIRKGLLSNGEFLKYRQ